MHRDPTAPVSEQVLAASYRTIQTTDIIHRSGSFTVVEVEHATQPLTPLDSITMETNDGSGTIDQLIADSLMISFPMIVRHVLRHCALK
jgi:hypothetical protein